MAKKEEPKRWQGRRGTGGRMSRTKKSTKGLKKPRTVSCVLTKLEYKMYRTMAKLMAKSESTLARLMILHSMRVIGTPTVEEHEQLMMLAGLYDTAEGGRMSRTRGKVDTSPMPEIESEVLFGPGGVHRRGHLGRE